MLVLLDTGIRVEELTKLTVDDVHEGYLTIKGKGRKEREVGITPIDREVSVEVCQSPSAN